jgi:3-oxoacyl-[acyl-carrier protein] reductase
MQVNADLRDKKVLLTGGAGGLGTAITLAFIEAGARVLALDVDKAKGERLLAECGSLGATPGSVRLVRGDLSDLGATANLVDALGREEGGIDVLINNAAIYYDLDRTENSLA